MSESDKDGDVGLDENPDPEEDSDWSQGVGQNVGTVWEEHSVNEQGEDPEDISCHSEVRGESNNENNQCLLPESEPQAAVSPEPKEDGNGRHVQSVSAGLVEGDSFEQDEQMAAPESENDAIQQACIESDQQLLHSADIVSLPELPQADTLESTNSTAMACERSTSHGEDASCNDVAPNVFNGDIQVDMCNGVDAPEDDIRQDQVESSVLASGAVSHPEGRGMSAQEESPVIESQRINHTSLDVERDSQIPECDRKEEGEVLVQSASDSNIIGSSVQTNRSGEDSSRQENQLPQENEHRNVCVEHSQSIDSDNHCEPADFSSNSPSLTHSSEDQSLSNPNKSPDSEISAGSKQEDNGVDSSPSCPTPSHSNSEFEHSKVTSPTHQSSHNPGTSSPHTSSSAVAPSNSGTTLLSISSPKVNKKPSLPHKTGSSAPASSISTEKSFKAPQAVDNHSHVATSNLHPIRKSSQNGGPSERSFHANSLSHGQESENVRTEHKAAKSLFGQSKGGITPESPEDYYQKQLALALSNDDDDDLDDIMSELDAELLSKSSGLSPKRSRPQSSSHMHNASRGQIANDKTVGKRVNGFVGDAEYKQLQDHNRQMLEQLKIRDAEIKKLCMERNACKAELSKVQHERQENTGKASSSSGHNADDLYLPQITALEDTIAQQQKEIQATKDKLIAHDTAAKRAVTTLQNELKIRVDQVTKQYEDAVKEKDSMVVMFATSESRVMESKKAMEKAENRLKDAIRDKESLISTLKSAKIDKQKAVNAFEQKSSELGDVKREMEKLKEGLSSADYRIKWFQNKLKEELETHKETKTNLDKTTSKLKETKEETEIIRRECQAIVKTYQESEEIKSNSLDKELKIKESQLKLQMQEWNDNEEIHQRTKKELETLRVQHREAVFHVNSLKEQVQSLEVSVAGKESAITQANELLNRQKTDITDIHSKLKEKQNLDDDFNRAQEMIKSLDKDVSELKVSNRDLQKDMESCRERESKMLALQSELSKTNACLRSENTTLSNKATNQTAEVERLKMEIQELETTVKHLSDSVEDEKKNNSQAITKLKASLEEKTKESSDFKQKWEDEIDSNKTLKRRHANNVKDLTRQLQQTKRRLEMVEGSRKDSSGSMGSRTNSNGSLNSMADGHQSGGLAGAGHHQNAQSGTSSGGNSQEFPVITEQVEIDKQVLIERIVRLQKSHARKNEKLEFLGEHIQQLLEEIKKKTKIIQSYVMREEAGTLSSEDMDANKMEARKEMQSLLSRKGGIMASMYSQHQQDGNMTLELSLQINKKLQAVLEDTLLKNITLKENLDTLGEEIARLSQVNRKLQLHLQDLENPKKH